MRLRINIIGSTRDAIANGLTQAYLDLTARVGTGTEETFEEEDVFYSAEFSELDGGDEVDDDLGAGLDNPISAFGKLD